MVRKPLTLFFLLCVGVLVVGFTYYGFAETIISATIEAPALTAAATITTPADGAVFHQAQNTVTGSCPQYSYVKVFVNGALNGVAGCQPDGSYTSTYNLQPGSNALKVQDYNTTDLAGPATPQIQVTYVAPATSTTTTTTTTQTTQTQANTSTDQSSDTGDTSTASDAVVPLQVSSDYNFTTFKQGEDFTWPIDLTGGQAPYNVTVDWGDGQNSDLHFDTSTTFSLHHVYADPGVYQVGVQTTDAMGAIDSFQLAAFITDSAGKALFIPTPVRAVATPAKPVLGWAPYAILSLMSASFVLGERRELALIYQKRRAARKRTKLAKR